MTWRGVAQQGTHTARPQCPGGNLQADGGSAGGGLVRHPRDPSATPTSVAATTPSMSWLRGVRRPPRTLGPPPPPLPLQLPTVPADTTSSGVAPSAGTLWARLKRFPLYGRPAGMSVCRPQRTWHRLDPARRGSLRRSSAETCLHTGAGKRDTSQLSEQHDGSRQRHDDAHDDARQSARLGQRTPPQVRAVLLRWVCLLGHLRQPLQCACVRHASGRTAGEAACSCGMTHQPPPGFGPKQAATEQRLQVCNIINTWPAAVQTANQEELENSSQHREPGSVRAHEHGHAQHAQHVRVRVTKHEV